MSCLLYPSAPAGFVSVLSLPIMAKVFGISVSAPFFALLCVYLLYQNLLRFNRIELASLDGYPNKEQIEADSSKFVNTSGPLFKPPLSTQGRNIIDENGTRLKLASVNWYGASDELFIPGGLDVQHRQDIAATIRQLGFNSVRLPYSDEMVRKNPPIEPSLLIANADLIGLRALEIYHAVVQSLTEAGLAVIINNHITRARWCCDANPCDGLWYNDYLGPICHVRQSESDWIENCITVMKPHTNNPFVVGVDLRNEVRALWGTLDWDEWANAAEKAARRLLRLQPAWLIIVEGLSSANDISGARSRPIQLPVPNKLVYSAHVYGWSGWGKLIPFSRRKYTSFANEMRHNWAYLLDDEIAPVWIGELGAPEHPNKGDLHYWKNLMKLLSECDADFGYWAINPRKPKNNTLESYSLVEDDWSTIRYDYRIHDLLGLMYHESRLTYEISSSSEKARLLP